MNERTMQFRVGVVVLATLLIGGILISMNTSMPSGFLPFGAGRYEVTIDLDEAPGIGPNTPVRRNGVLIGRVVKVVDDERVHVVAAIEDDRKIQTSDVCRVTVSILGDSTIEFGRGSSPPSGQFLMEGDVVEGELGVSPMEAFSDLKDDIRRTIISLGDAGDEVATLAKRVNNAFGDDKDEQRLARLLDKMDTVADEFSMAMRSMNDLIGDPQVRTDFKDTISEMRQTFRDARVTLDDMQVAVNSAERNLKNLEGFTEPLGRRGEDVTDRIISAVDGIDRLLEELTVFTQAVTSSEGSVGLMLRDRRLYDNLNQFIVNTNVVVVKMNDILAYLNERLPPVVEDARVFMDKIAREPGRLIGGALNRGPGIK
jgi:phospholipid/cholesterol/gamma-HCH transport system substrate-binding protein